MIKKIKKIITAINMLLFALYAKIINAQIIDLDKTNINNNVIKFREKAGFENPIGSGSLSNIIKLVIESFLSLLAIIFIILIIYAGFTWMTAGGDEAKVTKAKDTIQRSIIGIVIIIAAYSITYFVFNMMPMGGGAPPPPTIP